MGGANGVGFSHIVGIGGRAPMGFGEVLDWPRHPDRLIRSYPHRQEPARIPLRRVAATLRPVTAGRAGGLLLDPSGAADLAMEAALRRAGVVSVSRLDDLLAAAETRDAGEAGARGGPGHRHQRDRPRADGGRRRAKDGMKPRLALGTDPRGAAAQ